MEDSFRSREERFKTFILMRRERWEFYKTLVTFRMKYLLTIFSLFLTSTGIFYQLHGSPRDYHFVFLCLSWMLTLIGAGLLFIQFHRTLSWIVDMMGFEDEHYLGEKNKSHEDELMEQYGDLKKKGDRIEYISISSDVAFFLSLVLYFVSLIS